MKIINLGFYPNTMGKNCMYQLVKRNELFSLRNLLSDGSPCHIEIPFKHIKKFIAQWCPSLLEKVEALIG